MGESVHDNTAGQIRMSAQFLENRKITGMTEKYASKIDLNVSQRCVMCQMAVYGNMAKHQTSKLHLKLKNFIHPICELCDVKFQKRIDWDEHKLSAGHLIALEKEGHVVLPHDYYLDYQGYFLDVDEKSLKNKKNDASTPDADTEDPLEVGKTVEAAQLTLAKVLTYQVPEYNELEIVGSSYLQPVRGSFCKACRKLVPEKDYETHCKSKEHYDKFVDIVNGKKHKALQMESKISKEKEQENTAMKRKNDDNEDDDDEEDDTGNWKRQKKTEYPVAYDF